MTPTPQQTTTDRGRRELRGEVISDKMSKTVVVRVTRFVRHPRYGKFISPSKKYKAHDPTEVCRVGDIVTIRESKPLSKDKRYVVVDRQPLEEARRSTQQEGADNTADATEA